MSENSNYQDIVSYIESLHASRHHIAQAYCEHGIDINDDNIRALRQLQQIRVMNVNDEREDSLRLSRVIVDVLDHAVQRVRLFAVASNLAEDIDRLGKLADGYLKACAESRIEDQDTYITDFDHAAYGISEHIETMIVSVDTMAHNNFANVASYSEKIVQNRHYLDQMKRLVETVSQLIDLDLLEKLRTNADLVTLNTVYSRHILRKMAKWRAKLLDIIGYLEQYMSTIRSVEPFSRLVRMMSMHLHRYPEYAPKDAEDYPEIPEWAYIHEGLPVNPYPDIDNEENEATYIKIAKSIERTESLVKPNRTKGVVLEVDEEEQIVELDFTPFEKSLIEFVGHVFDSTSPQSAKAFFDKKRLELGADAEDSLMCLASILDSDKRKNLLALDRIDIVRNDIPDPNPTHGNIYITDFIACQKG